MIKKMNFTRIFLSIIVSWKIISLTKFSLDKLIEHQTENDFSEHVVVKQG